MTIHTQLPDPQYRALPQVAQSSLSNFVSYDVWGQRKTNLLTYKYPKPQEERFSKATIDQMFIGRVVDEALTEGKILTRTEDSFGDYTIVSKRMGKNEKEILSSTADEIESLYTSITRIPEIMEVIAGSEKQLVLTDDTLLSLPIKGKLDLLNVKTKTLIDLKTSGKTIDDFEKEFIFRNSISLYHRYTRQLAFYRLLCRQNGYEIEHVQIIFAGSDGVKVYGIPLTLLDRAESMIIADIDDLANALSENRVVTDYLDVPQSSATPTPTSEFTGF
jgi:hypothetical protein